MNNNWIQEAARLDAKTAINTATLYPRRPMLSVEDKIVAAIEVDISDRKGLKSEWNFITDDILEEILETWREIIRIELGKPTENTEISTKDLASQIKILSQELENRLSKGD